MTEAESKDFFKQMAQYKLAAFEIGGEPRMVKSLHNEGGIIELMYQAFAARFKAEHITTPGMDRIVERKK